jgi:hypothetical protein
MSRLLLTIAMVASLWPLGAIAAIAASDSPSQVENTQPGTDVTPVDADTTTGADEHAGAQAPPAEDEPSDAGAVTVEPDYATFRALRRRTDRLLKQLDRSVSMEGLFDPALEARARLLAADYRDWDASNGVLNFDLHRLAVAEHRIARRVVGFASAPTQRRLDRVNAAIAQFNRTVRAVKR